MSYRFKDGRIVHSFLLDVEDANCHLCCDLASGRAILIDAGEYSEALRDRIEEEKLQVEAILLTHTHYDHAGGVEEAAASLRAEVFVHHRGRESLKKVKAKAVRDGDVLSTGGFEIKVLATEGHTPDACCYLIGEALFTGDTLFNGSVGGTGTRDLFVQETENIKEKILTLPDRISVFPGHGPATTVGIERAFNPFL